MENEIDLSELDAVQSQAEKNLQVKDRFAKLSEKMTLSVKEKADAEAKAQAEGDRAAKAEKERDFYKDFSQVSSKHPNAAQHQDKIFELVNKGYTTEHATVAVLSEAGQLQPITAGTQPIANPAGGSAATTIADAGDKNPDEMSRDEKRQALLQAEKEGLNLLKF